MAVAPLEYTILDSVALRSRYVSLTDRLITMLEGGEGWYPTDVVFLDKSGRPVGWFVKSFWQLLAREPGQPYESGAVPPMPALRFANIDREHWWEITGATETGRIDIARLPDDVVSELRTVYVNRKPDPGESVMDVASWLDGKRVLIVDEVRVSGDTLRIAEALFRAAFPSADVRSTHWMTPSIVRDSSGQQRNDDVPVWYRSDTWEGRLVGNRMDPDNPASTWRNRDAGRFLSTRPRQPDQRGLKLRREVSALVRDVATRRLLFAPSLQRDPDEWAERVRVLYGYDDPKEFTAARLAAETK